MGFALPERGAHSRATRSAGVMDIATLIGLLAGCALVGWSIISGAQDKWMVFVNVPSILVVMGGTVAAAFISFPLKQVLSIAGIVKNAFLTSLPDPTQLIKDMVRYAEIARREGILALESVTNEIRDPFLVNGIRMAVDGTDPELIESILTSELETVVERHSMGKAVFDAIGKYGPAFGMIGTLIGLVIMLQNMDDPSKIGPGMAVALLTTLYGALLANLFALPLADKLSIRSQEEILIKSIIIRGVMSIQSGDNPRVVEQKLKSFLPPRARQALEAERK